MYKLNYFFILCTYHSYASSAIYILEHAAYVLCEGLLTARTRLRPQNFRPRPRNWD